MISTSSRALRGGLLSAAALCVAAAAEPALAVKFDFHGDLNNRFQLYNNQRDFFNGFGSGGRGVIRDEDNAEDENFGEIKYRLWTEAATDNDEVKGVFAFEIGGIRFGENLGNTRGGDGAFSGDGVNAETLWAYVDFGIPTLQDQRVVAGLQPHTVNKHLWSETATGITIKGPINNMADYSFAWMRGNEAGNSLSVAQDDDGFSGADNFSLNLNASPIPGLKGGVFVLYQHNDQTSGGTGVIDATRYEIKSISEGSQYDLWSFGTDGSYSMPVPVGSAFLNWSVIYQTGEIENMAFQPFAGARTPVQDFDVSAFFGRTDLGLVMGPTTVTYTFWYSSGDDDAGDNDFDAFIATDVDMFDSMIFFENYTDDNFFAETPYLLDKGFILNKLQVDHKLTPKVTVSGLASYHALAEDVALADGSSDDSLGVELGGRLSYKPYPSLEIGTEVAYLIGDDALDAFEEPGIQDGDSDENLLHWAMRFRYKF